jgi:hypothetical protein
LEHEVFLGTERDMDDIVAAVRKVQENSKLLARQQETETLQAGKG